MNPTGINETRGRFFGTGLVSSGPVSGLVGSGLIEPEEREEPR
jgi:hypothetical protein